MGNPSIAEENLLLFDFESILEEWDARDKGKDSAKEICKYFLKGQCAKGDECPFRHVKPEKAVVCKHWLRGLCKKGDNCEFLHEYDPKRMPECWFFAKYGECSNPECQFLHIRPEDKVKECPWYTFGFCKHGARCHFKHIKRQLCPDYMAGFCIKGPSCKLAHPKLEPPKDTDLLRKRPWTVFDAGQQHTGVQSAQKRQFTSAGPRPIPSVRTDEARENQAQPPLPSGMQPPFPQQQMQFPHQQQQNKKFRSLDQVTCFKCGQKGHYANACPNKRNLSIQGQFGRVQQPTGSPQQLPMQQQQQQPPHLPHMQQMPMVPPPIPPHMYNMPPPPFGGYQQQQQ